MNTTQIEWTERSWNPVTGCTPVSAGCEHCYAREMAETRLRGRCGYPADDPSRVTMHPGRLDEPLHMREPRRIFVCSMGDLFHEDVPDLFIERVYWNMWRADQHTFLILTKRPDRMKEFVSKRMSGTGYPHLWLGVSVEDQQTADARIPLLLGTPAAVRFVSYEPALGPVKFSNYGTNTNINWLIMGGESGTYSQTMYPSWARDTRDQCRAAGVPFFFKQWGHGIKTAGKQTRHDALAAGYNPRAKKGGRVLDGEVWDQYPEVAG